MSLIADLSQELAAVIPAVGSRQFCRLLVDAIDALVPVDEATMIVYESASLPVVDFTRPEPSAHRSLDVFVKGAFLLDPYYIAATEGGERGFFRLRDVAPERFRQSQYYRTYYRTAGLTDECGYLISIRGRGFVNLALSRTGATPFTRAQTTLLGDLTPLIEHLCGDHWRRIKRRPAAGNLRGQLDSALRNFGASVLTQRECEVVNLMLLGHPTKTIAEELGISPETVKLHRKHAYAKLDVHNQAQLFYLFIDSLKSVEDGRGGDPLATYLKSPREVSPPRKVAGAKR